MSAYTQWTRAQARAVCQRELMDTSARWWSEEFLNTAIEDWQHDLQEEFELVWGTATLTTALNTLTLSSISPGMLRLDAVYYIGTGGGRGYRLSGRLLQDLEVSNTEWRNATADTPREIIQYDSRELIVWPPLVTTGTFVFEYPRDLTLPSDSSTISLPAWTQSSVKYYVAMQAYLRQGNTNDLRKAMRYKAQWDKAKKRIKLLWDNWLPERYRRLKPGGRYEYDILVPPPAWSGASISTGVPDVFRSYIPSGDINGINLSFSIPIYPTSIRVFLNGVLLVASVDYTASGGNITFLSPPQVGDVIVVWTFTQG